ncbi:MAG: c-type cytochrome biogenesis protein CcmI [Dongiaceae bacterium]
MLVFWVIAGLLTLGTAAILAVPLFDTRKQKSDNAYAMDVYRDQLAEVARDQQRGVLNAEQGRAAQLEIERRILALKDDGASLAAASAPARSSSRGLIIALAVLLPLGGVALYAVLGQPELPDEPAADRAAADMANSPEIVALRQKVAANPADAQGWLDLARKYLLARQAQASVDAFAQAVALNIDGSGDRNSAAVYADYGRALIMLHNGQVTPDAEKIFAKTQSLDAAEPTARFFLALAKAQQGDMAGALTGWVALEHDSPPDAPWRQSLSENIDRAARQLGKDPANLPGREPGHTGGPAPTDQAAADQSAAAGAGEAPNGEGQGPGPQDLQNADQMSPEARAAFIQGMVDRLASRLKEQPNDLDGWLKLARAYTVLNQVPQALDAWGKAAALAPAKLDVQLDYANALIVGRQEGDNALPPAFIETVKRIRTLDAKNPLGLYYGGMVALADNRTDEARDLWRQVLVLLPEGSEQRAAMQREIDGLDAKPAN